MVPYVPLWSHMVPYGPLWSPMGLYGPLWFSMVLYCPLLSSIVLYGSLHMAGIYQEVHPLPRLTNKWRHLGQGNIAQHSLGGDQMFSSGLFI